MDASKVAVRRTDRARARAVLASRVDEVAEKVAPWMIPFLVAMAIWGAAVL
ncbi:hypothetical protein RR49_01196 [Microbacterium ginsengisoli]|uniref:Uncharacterized protein n=1 Tax=Microbacterium ginsengisoli TaxID=400772 RepID=A0A0F0LWJ2_9MICO|nr:hypothetical protein [Microbacterium ginsengisoli]KJL37084.1 hypothetical protein RR49_01196 [Microbacterium ginsengisoli]